MADEPEDDSGLNADDLAWLEQLGQGLSPDEQVAPWGRCGEGNTKDGCGRVLEFEDDAFCHDWPDCLDP